MLYKRTFARLHKTTSTTTERKRESAQGKFVFEQVGPQSRTRPFVSLQTPRLHQQHGHFYSSKQQGRATWCHTEPQARHGVTARHDSDTRMTEDRRRQTGSGMSAVPRWRREWMRERTKGQQKKGMSKILDFKVCSSVLALAAPLSLKRPELQNSHLSCVRRMHTSPGGSGMRKLEERDFSSFT